MPLPIKRVVLLLLLLICACSLSAEGAVGGEAATPAVPALGKQIADFELPDQYARSHRLGDFANRPVVAVVFLGIDCPLVKHYAQRLVELSDEFAPRGVQFIGVNANRQDSITALGQFARQHHVEFPLLKDAHHTVADQFGATRTPEVFVLDRQRRVVYQGRIDDQYGVGFKRLQPVRRDLAEALEDALANKPVRLATTDPAGCLIGRSPKVEPHGAVTYHQQVSRILAGHCVECHRPGEVGPFPLTSYDEVAGWAPMIAEVVQQNRMPPWFADPKYGQFKNDCRLSDEDRATLLTWIKNGAPEGDARDAPPPPKFVSGWRMEQPDLVLMMADEPFTVPATGVVDYQNYTLDPGFSEDKWIQAAEARPGNHAVVHHHSVYFVPPGGDRQMSQVANQIAGYAPGTPPFVFPPGTALRVPAGSKIIIQMHYTPIGVEQQDLSYVGIKFADPATVEREVKNEITGNLGIRIPPGESSYKLTADRRFRRDTLLLNLTPHMHVRGKAFRFELEHADGTREILLDVPRYDFNWQLRYDLVEPRLIPKGSRLHCYAEFDNSTDNPNNPDPTKEVRFGEQTWEEMMFGVYQTLAPLEKSVEIEPATDKQASR
ncbi:MAG: redoxin domain-containing protein [Pirellulales bacterium]|nr:redoxin domain-containing protein [Pirellulales bacterium]